MSSPAERYAAARRRTAYPTLSDFTAQLGFSLDPFQVEACEALDEGAGVLVCAPTGAGKTVVGEFAVHKALAEGRKAFYTTPIKALSNQKYNDLVERYGPEKVGLLTGDNAVNGDAPVIVMTTEVLRNMLYAESPALAGLGYVVMDEVHYLADRFRGAVWEEVIIHLPESVSVVSLSATVSNAEEFGEWLSTVRGDTDVVVEERRPVPLWQHVMVGSRLLDLFVSGGTDDGQRRVNPELQRLDRAALLPAITFVFSRAGCEAAVRQCLDAGLRLTSPVERDEIRAVVEHRCADIPDEDLQVLGYHEWADGLERGVAAHHAGMLPTFKEVVEELFVRGLVRAVFATETLALGINMPARSVVVERLVKWNGETHAEVTPAEYTQLTGRAGRRGIDVEGHAVVLWQPGLDATAVAGLASTRTYPLRSSFRPSYNMAVNLVGQVGRASARELLESSFAQFQADRAVVGLARTLRRHEEALDGYREAMTCHLGDFEEYAELRRQITEREASLARQGTSLRRAAAAESLERLRPGDVVRVPSGKFAGIAVVLDPGMATGGGGGGPRPTALTPGRQGRRASLVDFSVAGGTTPPVRIPRSFNPKAATSRRDLAAALRAKVPDEGRARSRGPRSPAADDGELSQLRRTMRAHPCHGCAEREDHARWAERWFRLRREVEQLGRRVESRTNTVARQFDRVCGVLSDLGYLRGDEVTPAGRRLSRLYTELDLLAAESLREGLWDTLDPAELAACLSSLSYESRQPDDAVPPRMPPGRVRDVLGEMVRLWGDLDGLEKEYRLDFLREPDLGFANAAWRWASGHRLESLLTQAGPTPGGFVPAVRPLLRPLGPVADAAGDTTMRETARRAAGALRRGVVDYPSLT